MKRSLAPVAAALLLACSRPAPPSAEALASEARALVASDGAVRWTNVASLLGDGVESCIDGRAENPVLGAPGGDIGEILVGLSALERTAREPIELTHFDELFDAYESSFGKLYMHTDRHAMDRLADAMRRDARFAGVEVPTEPDALARFVLSPPGSLEPALLELLTRPEHVGCSHMRFALSEPSRYGTRAELARAVVASAFSLAWRKPGSVDYVVLDGDHRERGILEVRLDHAVDAHSRVPMIAPHAGTKELFVHHPDVNAFVRHENGTFFLEHGKELVRRAPDEDVYLRELDALADRQARETLSRIARGLPTVHAVVKGDAIEIEGRRIDLTASGDRRLGVRDP